MPKLSPLEKETRFLYNKHNKKTQYPLEIEKIEFPLYITKILNKTTKRTPLETKKLTTFRKKILYQLESKSLGLRLIEEKKKEQERKIRQQKLRIIKDAKYEKDPTKTKHFGIWFDTNSNIKLNRDSYAKENKKVHFKIMPSLIEYYRNNPDRRSAIYENEECTLYSDSWCKKHKQDCLKNFDLNISYFEKLDDEKFNKALSSLLKHRKNFRQIYDINELENIVGIYILVLDNYKQVYIGQSKNIKQRILQHWRKSKEFDKLIYGRIETSILSIDSFGCLDTTRIFVIETETQWEIDKIERLLIDAMNKKYLLNRTAGGIHGSDAFTMLEISAKSNTRKL